MSGIKPSEAFRGAHRAPLSKEELERRLQILADAVDTGSDETVRRALKAVVPTYRSPEEVNAKAGEMGREPARL